MRRICRALAVLLLASLVLGQRSALRADGDDPPDVEDEIPVVGRPSDVPFSEASGQFEVTVQANPTLVEAETPLTFTVTVRAKGPVRQPPRRLDLDQVPAFAQRFYIEAARDGDSRHPDARTWEFLYRLKPRRLDVTEVPSLPFAFFDPTIRETSRRFQTIYTDPIPLRVTPHQTVEVPLRVPEGVFEIGTGQALLTHQTAWRPGVLLTLFLVLAPPLFCAGWYVCWRRRYPDAARKAQQRRSRAARQALSVLHGARRLAHGEQAERAASAVAEYLRQRLDLATAEPTPAESAAHLKQRGCSQHLAEHAARFFKACDAGRFLPAPSVNGADLADAAVAFILAVEEETCPVPSS